MPPPGHDLDPEIDDFGIVDTFDAYDSRVEKQAAIEALKNPQQVVPRARLTLDDVNNAANDAEKACCSTVELVSTAQCAALWDISHEVWLAYMRQVARDDEEAKEKLEGLEWSLKRRTYDL